MYVVSLNYVAPLEELDAVIDGHIAFLDRHYASGTFLASGRKVPRTGGVILARSESEEALRAILAEDPFWQKKLATYDIQQFVATKAQKGLEGLLD
ncbi:YciI family protein [Phyllobacterium meliloti]|uniref:YciI family protein n=1 Tax=Phyllobacterium meliloti TaxID=555317 RepID=UPI001D13C2D2|nr:YciI family protein [Phyllobacterium sp. T1293]UGX84741.1 YciI family protein [Phyllobacterium sp. T1293]